MERHAHADGWRDVRRKCVMPVVLPCLSVFYVFSTTVVVEQSVVGTSDRADTAAVAH